MGTSVTHARHLRTATSFANTPYRYSDIEYSNCQELCGLTAAEMSVVAGVPKSNPALEQMIRNYPVGLEPQQFRELIAYHIKAAIDLGLHEHARRLFATLCDYVGSHPELRTRPS